MTLEDPENAINHPMYIKFTEHDYPIMHFDQRIFIAINVVVATLQRVLDLATNWHKTVALTLDSPHSVDKLIILRQTYNEHFWFIATPAIFVLTERISNV